LVLNRLRFVNGRFVRDYWLMRAAQSSRPRVRPSHGGARASSALARSRSGFNPNGSFVDLDLALSRAFVGSRSTMIRYALLFSKQSKIRLSKYYVLTSQKDRKRIEREVMHAILPRPARACNVVEYRDAKLVYRRYASLYFCLAVDRDANELAALEAIQHYVEILDKYFGNVCELDLVFNFHKAHYVLDEVFIAGHLQETSKKLIAKLVGEHDALVERVKLGGPAAEDS